MAPIKYIYNLPLSLSVLSSVCEREIALNAFNRRFRPDAGNIARERLRSCCVVEIAISEMTGRQERERKRTCWHHSFSVWYDGVWKIRSCFLYDNIFFEPIRNIVIWLHILDRDVIVDLQIYDSSLLIMVKGYSVPNILEGGSLWLTKFSNLKVFMKRKTEGTLMLRR